MQPLRTFFMESWLENNRFHAKYNLGESGGRPRTVGDILTSSSCKVTLPHERAQGFLGGEVGSISEKFLNIPLNDSPNWGRHDLRELVASFHPGATAENVLITTGTSEALFLLFHVLRPKSLALPIPAFQLLYEIPKAFGANIIELPVYWDENGKPFIDQNQWLSILEETKPECILINNPHNPSGLIFKEEFLSSLKTLANQWGAYFIGDEHYRFLASETKILGHTIYENKPNTFITGSFIKCLGTPGLRIGWCVGDPKFLSLMQNEKNYTTHTVSPIIEWIAYEVLKNIQSDLFKKMKQEWCENRKLLANFLTSSQNIYGVEPEGGLVTSLGFTNASLRNLPAEVSMEKSMSYINSLNQKGVFVLPLSAMEVGNFDFQKSENYKTSPLSGINRGFGFRLGLGITTQNLSQVLGILEHAQ